MAYFKEVLSEAGVTLGLGKEPNTYSQQQSLVMRDLERTMEYHMLYPDNVREFIEGLKEVCKNEDSLEKALLPSRLVKESGGDEQESLMKVLLNVDCMQKSVLDFVLEELTRYVATEGDERGGNLVKLLLGALKYLPYVKDADCLSKKLLDALEVAELSVQKEILSNVPDIIPDSYHCEVAKKLVLLLDQSTELCGAIIDCLSGLNITDKTEVKEYVSLKMFSGNYFKIYPIVYDFLMSDCPVNDLKNILFKMRKALDTVMTTNGNDSDSDKLIFFEKLHSSAIQSKAIFDGWISLISNMQTRTDYSPVDLLILFMLHTTAVRPRRKTVEIILKKKFKHNQFNEALVEDFFNKYLTNQIIKILLDSIISAAHTLLNQINQKVITFASLIYKLAFIHEQTDCTQHQEILDKLLLVKTNEEKTLNCTLHILKSLLEDTPKLQKHTTQLMSALNTFDSMSIQASKILFEVLCALTCTDESYSGFKDELHMLIRKGLSSSRPNKFKSIVCSVVMAKHIVSVGEGESESDDSVYESAADLPVGASRDAAALLELTSRAVESYPEGAALYYDQLAQMLVSSENLDKKFFSWLYESVSVDFRRIFVSEDIPNAINGIIVTEQYSLNTADEIDNPLYINIAEIALKEENSSSIVLVLAPLFRLLRMLCYKKNDGNLEAIDALLGCGVLMPETEDVSSLATDQVKQVANCVFHCINWFVEDVNGFVGQRSRQLQSKVIGRLDNLMELEETLNKCMDEVPDHVLPHSYYMQESSKKIETKRINKNQAKRFKSNEIVNNPNETVASVVLEKPSTSKASVTRKFQFREFDTDIIKLLRYHVNLNFDSSQSSSSTQKISLSLKQFNYVLKDATTKLKKILHENPNELSHFNLIKPIDLLQDFKNILPNIYKTFKLVSEQLKSLDTSQLFTQETNELKITLYLILDCLHSIFSWSGFENPKNKNLLRDILKCFAVNQQSQQITPIHKTISELSQKLFEVADQSFYLPGASSLVKLMQSLHNLSSNEKTKKMVQMASEKLLKRDWKDLKGYPEITSKPSLIHIDDLVKAYLDGADVKTLSSLVGTLQQQADALRSKQDSLEMLESINKYNFHIFFNGLCQALHKRLQTEITALTNQEHLVLWKRTALTLSGLMSVVKIHENKSNLVSFMKQSIAVLKIFLKQGIPILEIMLRSKPDEVVEILKTLQNSTRFIHHLCCHSKLMKDIRLMAFAPKFKFTLETLIYCVKAALVANNCADAFWMGNLKNKDLHGEIIASQQSTSSEEVVQDSSSDEGVGESEEVDDEGSSSESRVV